MKREQRSVNLNLHSVNLIIHEVLFDLLLLLLIYVLLYDFQVNSHEFKPM